MDQIDAILLLKTSCKEIDPYWQEYMDYWQDDEERGFLNDISVISRYIVERFALGKTDDFKEIFDAYEYISKHGNEAAKELAIIGFLEGILYLSSRQKFGDHALEKWMGPCAKKDYNHLRKAFKKLESNTKQNSRKSSIGVFKKFVNRLRGAGEVT